jgi:hypothetical protein
LAELLILSPKKGAGIPVPFFATLGGGTLPEGVVQQMQKTTGEGIMGRILIIDDDMQVGDMPAEVPGARAAAFALVGASA